MQDAYARITEALLTNGDWFALLTQEVSKVENGANLLERVFIFVLENGLSVQALDSLLEYNCTLSKGMAFESWRECIARYGQQEHFCFLHENG